MRPMPSIAYKLWILINDFHIIKKYVQLLVECNLLFTIDHVSCNFLRAKFSPEVTNEIRQVAIRAYKALECRGFARIDMFLTEKGEVLVNELNTLPAFRSDSSYPKLWKATGVSPSVLWDRIIDFSLEKY